MKTKNVITLGIAGISLILAASITSTVAWYTGSSYLAITNIDVRLKDPNLTISVDNYSFVSKLNNDSLGYVDNFTAVTSAFSNEWIKRKEQMPVFRDGYAAGSDYVFNKASDYTVANTGYFSKVLYLKSDIDAYATFDKELTRFLPNTENNHSEKLDNVVNCMRFSILVLDYEYKYYIYDPNKSGVTYLGGILDSSNSGYYNTYAGKEILYGEVYSNDPQKDVRDCIVYDDPLEEETHEFERNEMTCFNANNARGDRKVNFEKSVDLVRKIEDSISYDEVEKKLLIPLKANVSTKIVLSFYQEGWDLDNTNFIVHSNFFTTVSFMIAPVMPPVF